MEKRLVPLLIHQGGAVLLMLLVCVTLVGLMAGLAGSSWETIVQRAKEADLLWKGNQIRRAIGNYYNTSHGQGKTPKIFPSSLDYLVKDPRFLETRRYLRHLYPDPMTGEDWVVIKAPDGKIMGVRSSSEKEPFQQDNFNEENKSFTDQKSYKDWQFVYNSKKKTVTKNVPAVNVKMTVPSN